MFVTDVISGDPVENAKLSLWNKDNHLVHFALPVFTDENGYALMKLLGKHRLYESLYLRVEKDSQMSLLPFNKSKWNTSTFDVGGITKQD